MSWGPWVLYSRIMNKEMNVIKVDCYFGEEHEELEMCWEQLIDWVHYYYAYEEFDRILVDGKEVIDLIYGMD
jgi:hypothetical protein